MDMMRLVAVKLTATEYQAVLDLVKLGKARTISCALRQGLMLLLEEHSIKFEARLKIRQERIQHKMRKPKSSACQGE
jgi:hypothetical protein